MVKEVRIYIEGGGDGKDSKAKLRQGFSLFLKEICATARSKKIGWNIILCGSRNTAFRDFKNALEDHPNAFNILLVDAEAPYKTTSPWQHLKNRDNWSSLDADDNCCHLMIQTMEAWLIADITALENYYGQGFNTNAIPKNSNVEEIDKETIEVALKIATKNTGKGEYHKINHAAKLLELLNVEKVCRSAPYCDRFFATLTQFISHDSI